MSDVSTVRELSVKIIDFSAKHYGIANADSFKNKKEELYMGMYEFLKYVYGGTMPCYIHHILRGDKYFTSVFKQEGAWSILGGTLPDQKELKLFVPKAVRDILPLLPEWITIEWFHTNGDRLIPDDVIDKAVKEWKDKNSK